MKRVRTTTSDDCAFTVCVERGICFLREEIELADYEGEELIEKWRE